MRDDNNIVSQYNIFVEHSCNKITTNHNQPSFIDSLHVFHSPECEHSSWHSLSLVLLPRLGIRVDGFRERKIHEPF